MSPLKLQNSIYQITGRTLAQLNPLVSGISGSSLHWSATVVQLSSQLVPSQEGVVSGNRQSHSRTSASSTVKKPWYPQLAQTYVTGVIHPSRGARDLRTVAPQRGHDGGTLDRLLKEGNSPRMEILDMRLV